MILHAVYETYQHNCLLVSPKQPSLSVAKKKGQRLLGASVPGPVPVVVNSWAEHGKRVQVLKL